METKGFINPDGTVTMTDDVKKGENFCIYVGGLITDNSQQQLARAENRLANMKAALGIVYEYLTTLECACSSQQQLACTDADRTICERCSNLNLLKRII